MATQSKTPPDGDPLTIQRAPTVAKRIGVDARTIRRWEMAGKFPRRVEIGPNCIGYFKHEVDEWIANRARRRDHTRPSPNPSAARGEEERASEPAR